MLHFHNLNLGGCNAYQYDAASGTCDLQSTVNTTTSQDAQHKIGVLHGQKIIKVRQFQSS